MNAQQVWHAVVSESEKVPVDEIEYIVSRPEARSLDIVLNDGATVYEGIPSLQFEYSERAGLTSPHSDDETILGPYDNVITVKGLAEGSQIKLYNPMGQLVDVYTSGGKQQSIDIDLSQYQPGVYVLKTRNSAVKFVKR
ncbi:MAG: T9SS type A sorting domain-containing protein [Muribaculaceae bacterium]|nr:T9SS type A sorting domain-containing protein [Muribaculaceae bacterium]MDE6321884.1 T9SS type A sorting domain-containing protein [Muribaculaceae bacterium]